MKHCFRRYTLGIKDLVNFPRMLISFAHLPVVFQRMLKSTLKYECLLKQLTKLLEKNVEVY